jgi:hypothetical protein
MANLQLQQNALVRGTSCWVRAGKDANSVKKIGFCDSFRGTKNMQLQRAQVCGEIYPVSIDPQGISVTLSISGFIPAKGVLKDDSINGNGDVSIMNLDPDAENFIEEQTITKIPYLEFYDESSGDVITYFTNVIPQSFSVTINGGSYIKGDLQMEALTMSGGEAFSGLGLANSLEIE